MKEFADSKEKPPVNVAHGLFYIVKMKPQEFADVMQYVESLRAAYSLSDADLAIAPMFLTETSFLVVDSKWCVAYILYTFSD